MIDLYDELHRVVRALDAAGVAYAIVGGFAVSLHARARTTDDIDLLITEGDLAAATAAVHSADYEARMAPFPVAKGRLRIQRYLKTVDAEIVLVDALLAREPEHTAMLERAIPMESASGRLHVVTREDLRTLKRMRGSPQDLADLAALDAGGVGAIVREQIPMERVEQTLRRVSQLRTLFLRLPHLPSPREQAQIAAFQSFVAGHEGECSADAMEAGFRDAHRRLDAEAILAAARLAGSWLRTDPVLHAYVFWAEQFARDSALAARTPQSPRE